MKHKRSLKYREKINLKKEASLLPGYIVLIVWVLFTAAMLFWIMGASLSTSREIFSGSVFKFKTGFHWENYVSAWKGNNVSIYFGNSLLYSVISCIAVVLISAPGAYVLSRFTFLGNKPIRTGLIIAMSIPEIMIIMPIYSLSVSWHVRGRLLLIVLYSLVRVPFTTTYLINFFASLSRSYEEAAALDGCTAGRAFWKIMLPLIQPALITVTIFNFMSVWNEFFMALIFAGSVETMPLGVGLLQIVNAMKYTGDYGGLFAAVVIVFLPTFILYLFMSEKIITGVTGGGVKG